MKRLLVIPAAGRGSRLGWAGPKALCPVAGRPMISWLFDLYAPFVDAYVVVSSPAAEPEFRDCFRSLGVDARIVIQERPTGMLPAILSAAPAVLDARPEQIWITWCDQIGISDTTIRHLADTLDSHADASFVFPTVRQPNPYIHFERDPSGRLVHVLHRREHELLPPIGESDAGLFALRRDAFQIDLIAYHDLAPVNAATHEVNFLPFIPWLAARRTVLTFEVPDPREATGINTPEDLAEVERYVLEGRLKR